MQDTWLADEIKKNTRKRNKRHAFLVFASITVLGICITGIVGSANRSKSLSLASSGGNDIAQAVQSSSQPTPIPIQSVVPLPPSPLVGSDTITPISVPNFSYSYTPDSSTTTTGSQTLNSSNPTCQSLYSGLNDAEASISSKVHQDQSTLANLEDYLGNPSNASNGQYGATAQEAQQLQSTISDLQSQGLSTQNQYYGKLGAAGCPITQ